MEHWEKDEKDLEIQNEYNQKIHRNDGDMVEDLVNLDEQKIDSDHDSEENDPEIEEDQDPRSELKDSKKSEEEEDDGPRRSKRSREPPERLNPTMTGQSYAIRKMNIEMKRKMKKDIKIRTKKKFREEHYSLYTQGTRTEADCTEYTNLEGMILAIFMVRFNEFTHVGYKSFSQQYQLGKGLKMFGEKGHKASSSELEQLHHRKCFIHCQLIEQQNLDSHSDLEIPFGSYVEAAQKTTNAAKARTRSAIYLE